MAAGLKNLGSSIKSDAAGVVGHVTKAILVFLDTESSAAINLEEWDEVVNYAGSLGMTDKDEITLKAAALIDNDVKSITSSARSASKVANSMKNVGAGASALTKALADKTISGKKFTVQFNPSSIQVIGRGGGRVPISNYGSVGQQQAGTIEYRALDPYINVSFTVVFDATNNADAFMEERFTVGLTTGIKNVATAVATLAGKEYTVKPQVEGFLAALRNENHRTMIFQWGSLRYTGVLNSLSGQYTMFNTAGDPIRAEVQVGMLMANTKNLDGNGYMEYWKKRYSDILKNNANKDKNGNITSMTTGNAKNQYTNLINL